MSPAASPTPPGRVADLDWDAERAEAFADQAVGIWREYLERLPSLPISRGHTADEVRAAMAMEVPDDPMPDEELLAFLRAAVLEWSVYAGHPGFMAYVTGAGTVPGAVADLLAAGVNMNVGGWLLSPSATEIERQLIHWLTGVFGLPEGAGGLLVSGGAMANFVALKAARDAKAGWDVRREGVGGPGRPPLAMYLSSETHVVSQRASDMLGLGWDAMRSIPVDDRYRVDTDALSSAIATDRNDGVRPIAIVGSAGTVATGAVDPLDELADLCAAEDLWFHVDAAYGGPAVLADDLRPVFAGIERADSIAFDPHKWLYTPHSGGCVLLRDEGLLGASFAVDASYVRQDKERTGAGIDFARMGPQFSRGFWALKVWVSLLAHGRDAYARRISHDAELARYLGALVEASDMFELATPVSLSICCFRYVPPDLTRGPADTGVRDAYLSELNERIMSDLQRDGRAYCSNAVLGDRFWLRACIVNFRTEAEHLDRLLEVAAELGSRLDAELRPASLGGTA
ncbi:MAG: pyridoxal-dependent decarboxylase [Actinomycetota bacterium]